MAIVKITAVRISIKFIYACSYLYYGTQKNVYLIAHFVKKNIVNACFNVCNVKSVDRKDADDSRAIFPVLCLIKNIQYK